MKVEQNGQRKCDTSGLYFFTGRLGHGSGDWTRKKCTIPMSSWSLLVGNESRNWPVEAEATNIRRSNRCGTVGQSRCGALTSQSSCRSRGIAHHLCISLAASLESEGSSLQVPEKLGIVCELDATLMRIQQLEAAILANPTSLMHPLRSPSDHPPFFAL